MESIDKKKLGRYAAMLAACKPGNGIVFHPLTDFEDDPQPTYRAKFKEEEGTPDQLFHHPKSRRTAEFLAAFSQQ